MSAAASVAIRYRVLVVDDVALNRLIAIDLLNRLGIHSEEAVNGDEAVRAVQSGTFDLVLMDIQMPVMDGLVATATIRALPMPAANIPIIAVTAAAGGDDGRCAAAGMNDFLAKPVIAATFTAKIRKWLPMPVEPD